MGISTPLSLGLWLALASAAWAQTQPEMDLKDPQAVAALQRDLSSDDFATRDRAQALLDRTPLSARDDLARLADAATDPEAQSRLRARVEVLDDFRVTTVPPISLDLKNATLPQVAAALAQATGQPFTCGSAGMEAFTVKADALSFWEIYRQLNAQGPVWFNVGVNDIRLNRTNMNWRDMSITRGVAVFLQDLKAPPAARAGSPPIRRYATTLALGIDPRICILQLKPPEIAPVTDNAGNRWNVTATSAAVSTISVGRGIAFQRPITLEPSGAGAGTTLPALRGVFPIVVQSGVESKTFDPAHDALNTPFALGNVAVSVTRCTISGGEGAVNANIAFDLDVHIPPEKNAGPPPFPIGPVTINILDATGKTILIRTLPLGFLGSMSNSLNLPAQAPITLRLDVTTAVREVKIPFDFKDVPIP